MADSIRVSLPTSGDEHELDSMEPLEEARSSMSGPPGDGQHRPQKRRRIPVACGACRSKKSRVSPLSGPGVLSQSGRLFSFLFAGWVFVQR